MNPIARTFTEAAQQAGYPYNPDYNGADQDGVARIDTNFVGPHRQSTAWCYLRSARKRPNLQVITHATVSRIVVENGRATGVEYYRKGRQHRLQTEGEVLLAAGATNTPQLLQLSGIGDPGLLQPLGIPVVRALPGVGQNLQDHPAIFLTQEITQPVSLARNMKPLNMALALAQYGLFRSGPINSIGQEAIAFLRTLPTLPAPDVQFHLVLMMYGENGKSVSKKHGFLVVINPTRPVSEGSVRIVSGDFRKAPAIDLGLLKEEADVATMRRGLQVARNIVAQPAFDGFRAGEVAPGAAVTSDDGLAAYIRAASQSVYHIVGTCRMAPEAQGGVVDDQLRVHGVAGLRVIDASIMPNIVSGNTNAATMMIAEKASELVLAGAR